MKSSINTIYIIRCNLHAKVYIGQTWSSIVSRFGYHRRSAKNNVQGCIKLNNSIRKYGIENFIIEKLDESYSQEAANELEDQYILKFDSIKTGLNCKRGGAHGEYSQESKNKMSKSKMGIKNNRYGITGAAHPMFGKTHTNEAKQKIIDAQTGEKHWSFGKTVSTETKTLLTAQSRAIAKLTIENVLEIRKLIIDEMSTKDIALM
jgi:group I intron endonuclease